MPFSNGSPGAWTGLISGAVAIAVGIAMLSMAVRAPDWRAQGRSVAESGLMRGIVNGMALEIVAVGLVVVAISAAMLAGIFA